MSKVNEADLGAVFNPLRRAMDYRDIDPTKRAEASIKAKIDAALKAYPEWAKQQRSSDPTYMASLKQQTQQTTPTATQGTATTQQTVPQRTAQQRQAQQRSAQNTLPTPNLRAAPTSIAGYDAKRDAAAKRAQADMVRGKLPPGNYTSPMSSLLRQRQARGMTESRFDDLYALLESALYEQEVSDPGTFSKYIETVLDFKLDNDELKQLAASIDQNFTANNSTQAYQTARKLLDYVYRTQMMGSRSRSGIAQGIPSSSSAGTSTGSTQLDRVLTAMRSNYYTQEEITSTVMNMLIYMKRKYPADYNVLVRDIRTSLADFQRQTAAPQNQQP